jgi:hypothetical protein
LVTINNVAIIFRFGHIFHELEDRGEELGVRSFGLSFNTLEQVFLKVGEQAEALRDSPRQQDRANGNGNNNAMADGDVVDHQTDTTDGVLSEAALAARHLFRDRGFCLPSIHTRIYRLIRLKLNYI